MDIMTKRIKTTASQPVYDDRGKELFGPIADKEREDRYLDMSREREKIEAEHDHAKQEVEIAMTQRIGSKLVLKRGNVDEASSKCTWVLYFSGINKARFENLVAHKTDWNGIRLAIGWSGRPSYTCRGSVPDGSKVRKCESRSDAQYSYILFIGVLGAVAVMIADYLASFDLAASKAHLKYID